MLMKKFKLLITFALLAVGVSAYAQNIKVSGIVSDQDGAPLPGATVLVQGTTNGTLTDLAGAYSITAPANATLEFRSVGYEVVAVKIDGQTIIDVTLKEDARFIDEAVIVGYGSAKKVGTIVGSVTTVKSESLKDTPTSSAFDKLQGQVAGLSVYSSGGAVGDDAVTMSLHGKGSLTAGTDPLYIVDGIPASSRTVMGLNPNDIKSVSVLKDASATSIYGSRAANGVVYITTKGGVYSGQATVTARSVYGVSTLADWSVYTNMMSGAELKDFWLRSGMHTPESLQAIYLDNGFDADTKWWKYFQNEWAPQYQNEVSIEGGNKTVAYMIGASQFHQTGTAIGNYLDKYTVTTNVQAHPTKWLKVGLKANMYTQERQMNSNWNFQDLSGDDWGVYTSGGGSYLQNPLYPAVDENGVEPEDMYSSGFRNQKTQYKYLLRPQRFYGILASAFVEIEPIRDLKIMSRVGTDSYFVFGKSTNIPSYSAFAGSGSRGRDAQITLNNTITNTIEYSFEFADINKVSVLAGQEGTAYSSDNFTASSSKQNDDRLLRLQDGNTSTFKMSESWSEYKFLSYFGHLDYSIADKYLFDATVRNDASSRFGANNRDALFWAAGAMWKAKKEGFLSDVSIIDDLNLKVSYGTQGNAAIDNYSHLGLIGTSGAYDGSRGKVLAQPANPDLTWEKQALLTVALTGKAFGAVDFDIEFYKRNTSAMLMEVPYPYTSGFTSLVANVGGLTNHGVDITLGADLLSGKDYYFRVDANFSYNVEKVTKLFDGRNEWLLPDELRGFVVGQPVNFYLPLYAGVDPADGKQMWYVPGDDVTVTNKDPNNVTKTFNEEALIQNSGLKMNPPMYGGFSLSGAWKGLSARADFSYVIGKWLINNDRYFYDNPNVVGNDYNQRKDAADFWTPYNTTAKYPDWTTGQKMQFDTHLLEDASFLRLKSLQVGYSLKGLLGWQKVVKDAKITFTGRNLLTLTKYTGMDPEVDGNITYGVAGNSRQFLGGIEITF